MFLLLWILFLLLLTFVVVDIVYSLICIALR